MSVYFPERTDGSVQRAPENGFDEPSAAPHNFVSGQFVIRNGENTMQPYRLKDQSLALEMQDADEITKAAIQELQTTPKTEAQLVA